MRLSEGGFSSLGGEKIKFSHLQGKSLPINEYLVHQEAETLQSIWETMVFILAETSAGYAIFKAKDKALKNRKTLDSVENATSM
jgi:hypothetical protein